MGFLILASIAVGLAYGRLPHLVSVRVFHEEATGLLRREDICPGIEIPAGAPTRPIAVQLVTAALFGVTTAVIGLHWVVVAYLWFVAVTITLTITDVDRKLIPNRVLFPATGLSAVLLVAGALADGDGDSLLRAAGGAGGYFAVLFVIALVVRDGFGMGDVKLAVLLGGFVAFRSWEALFVAGIGAFLLGGAASLLLLALRMKRRKDAIPFGPYLVTAAYIAIAVGSEIADWYGG